MFIPASRNFTLIPATSFFVHLFLFWALIDKNNVHHPRKAVKAYPKVISAN